MPTIRVIAASQCRRIFNDPRTDPSTRAEVLKIYLGLKRNPPQTGRTLKPTKSPNSRRGKLQRDKRAQEAVESLKKHTRKLSPPQETRFPPPPAVHSGGPTPTSGYQLKDFQPLKTHEPEKAESAKLERELQELIARNPVTW